MTDTWNVLPGMLVEADRIMSFKLLLGRHMNMSEMEGTGSCAAAGN